ncbi:unnamed protein product [Candidula unifasciata]|uniref:RBR-type E3 ubiquitin transferase n=1 Tax=Candidula unifasciata TaxID=100452 RepID=A0A8S3YXT0_9EUPU|nr:unnamed protein product [Candidula unifasciata]
MVLKKSNSKLNSGATQRAVTHAGINKLQNVCLTHHPHILNVENYLLVTTDISMADQEAKDRLQACLGEMYTYLGFDMPNLSHAINGNVSRSNVLPNSAKYVTECSLEKNRAWLLPERITEMQADVDFLRSLTRNLHIRFHEVVNAMITTSSINSLKSVRTKTFSSSEILDEPSTCDKQPTGTKAIKSRRKQTCHNRGVQRSHLFNRKQKKGHELQHCEEEKENKFGNLDVYLFAPSRLEARSTYYRMEKKFARRTNASRLKSSTKMNGRSKGRFPCRQGYCNRDLAVDAMNGIKEVYEDNINSTDFDNNEAVSTADVRKSPEMTYFITDFISIRRRGLKGEKRDKKKEKKKVSTEDEEDTKGYAQLLNRIRHPKGSFVVVSKDECHLEDKNHEVIPRSLPRQEDSGVTLNDTWPVVDDGIRVHTNENVNSTRVCEIEGINDFDSGFVLVKLVLSEEQEKWFSSSQERRNTEMFIDNKYLVKCGNSHPECFIVDCNSDKIQTSGQGWRLINGRKSPLESDLWLVSIQNQWQTSVQTKQYVQNCIPNYKNTSLSLRQLITLVTALDGNETVTQPSRTSQPVKEKWMSSNIVWRNMPLNIVTTTESCTIEETHSRLKETCVMSRNVSQQQIMTVESPEDSHLTQCGVCFMEYDNSNLATSPVVLLPCSHTYCVSCWRAHLQNCIRNGANSLPCMSTNCTNLMDIVTISTILPYTLVRHWQNQVISRRIDSSLYCQWCPNFACDKVAVSRNEMLKQQFGKVITCVCQQCWCSGCQGDPHWPSSCDQMAAYRKLLTKTNKTITFSKNVITFEVEVKRCPGCRYPIEKNAGCPTMNCAMCKHCFCWTCMKPSHTHSVCKEKNVETTVHVLKNKLEITGPLHWYPRCLRLKIKMEQMKKIHYWIHSLRRKAACPRLLSFPVYPTNQAAQTATSRAEECVLFFKQAYAFQESMHVLTGFAELSECPRSRSCAKQSLSKMSRLDFIMWRLRETVLEKSLSQLCKRDTATEHLIRAGRDVMRELSVLVPALQHFSKDIDTTSVGELDPALMIRHK